MSSKDLIKKVESTLFRSDLVVNKTFIEFTPDLKIIASYEAIIENKSNTPLDYIRLPVRSKSIISPFFETEDSSGNKLLELPQNIVHSILIEISVNYLNKLIKKLINFDKKEKLKNVN